MARHRDVMASPFAARGFGEADDVDPMQSVANISDCMLVLACGLMLALVMYWNLDVAPAMDEVEMDTDLTELPTDLEEAQMAMNSEGAGYEEMGVVYRDPKTGKMYMLKSEAEGTGASEASGNE